MMTISWGIASNRGCCLVTILSTAKYTEHGRAHRGSYNYTCITNDAHKGCVDVVDKPHTIANVSNLKW